MLKTLLLHTARNRARFIPTHDDGFYHYVVSVDVFDAFIADVEIVWITKPDRDAFRKGPIICGGAKLFVAEEAPPGTLWRLDASPMRDQVLQPQVNR